jgi:hypothetical protein
MILWFLNIRHSGTLFGMWFPTLAQQLFLLILPSIGWICGAHGYGERVQLKSCILPSSMMVQKELRKFSRWFWKGFLKWYDGGGENGITSKMIFEVEASFSSQNVNFPFIWRDFGDFLFFSFFSSISWGLRVLDDIWGEIHIFEKFFSNGFNILVVDAYSGMDLCTPIWLNHDCGDGGVVVILEVDEYSGVDVCTPKFICEDSN